MIPPFTVGDNGMAQLDPASILGPGGAVARRLPAYELRSQQLEMAQAVARAIERPGHVVVEAGTGVGKSFAYLVPTILAAVEQKKKIVISTHTIALQEQLLRKDIPFLRSVMPQEFSAVLVKGRSNYISLRRLDVAGARATGTFQKQEEFDQLGEIKLWANRTNDGSRSDLDFRPLPGVWDAVQSENGNCLGRDCPRNKECFYFQARRRRLVGQLADRQPCPLRHRPGTAVRGLRDASQVRRGRFLTRRTRSRPWPASTWGCRSRTSVSISPWRGCTTTAAARACCRFTGFSRPWTRSRMPVWPPTISSSRWPSGSCARVRISTVGSAGRSTGPTPCANRCRSSPRPSARGRPRSRNPNNASS